MSTDGASAKEGFFDLHATPKDTVCFDDLNEKRNAGERGPDHGSLRVKRAESHVAVVKTDCGIRFVPRMRALVERQRRTVGFVQSSCRRGVATGDLNSFP